MRFSLIPDKTRDAAILLGMKEVTAFIGVQYPFFNLPIVRALTALAVGGLMRVVINETQLGLIYVCAFGNSQLLVDDFKRAWESHYEIEKSGTPEQIAASEAALVDKARSMLNLSKPI